MTTIILHTLFRFCSSLFPGGPPGPLCRNTRLVSSKAVRLPCSPPPLAYAHCMPPSTPFPCLPLPHPTLSPPSAAPPKTLSAPAHRLAPTWLVSSGTEPNRAGTQKATRSKPPTSLAHARSSSGSSVAARTSLIPTRGVTHASATTFSATLNQNRGVCSLSCLKAISAQAQRLHHCPAQRVTRGAGSRRNHLGSTAACWKQACMSSLLSSTKLPSPGASRPACLIVHPR